SDLLHLADEELPAGTRRNLRRMGDRQYLQAFGEARELMPIASATSPPTPVSISSKTSVGAEPLAASTTLSASMKRASSPPEATLINGASGVPGLAATRNSILSMPWGPSLVSSTSISVSNR